MNNFCFFIGEISIQNTIIFICNSLILLKGPQGHINTNFIDFIRREIPALLTTNSHNGGIFYIFQCGIT